MATSTTSYANWSALPTPTSNNADEPFLLPFDDVTVAVVAVILIFFMVFGFFGNLLTIIVIVTSKKLDNIFNQFILSLCFSDLYSASVSWINLYRRTWGFNVFVPPNFFCWFFWGSEMLTSYVTALHIVSFAILRLLSIWKPLFFSKIRKIHGRIWITTIWIIGLLCGFVPFALFSGAKMRDRSNRSSPTARWPSCTQNQETLEDYSSYIKYAYPIFFYVPLVTTALVSLFIGIVLVRNRMNGQRMRSDSQVEKDKRDKMKEQQAIMQLSLIVGSFIMGYLPFTVFEFWTLHNTDTTFQGWKNEWLFGTVQYMFLRLSECLNPVFYNLASTKMRQETRKFLRRLICARCPNNGGDSAAPHSTASFTRTGLEL